MCRRYRRYVCDSLSIRDPFSTVNNQFSSILENYWWNHRILLTSSYFKNWIRCSLLLSHWQGKSHPLGVSLNNSWDYGPNISLFQITKGMKALSICFQRVSAWFNVSTHSLYRYYIRAVVTCLLNHRLSCFENPFYPLHQKNSRFEFFLLCKMNKKVIIDRWSLLTQLIFCRYQVNYMIFAVTMGLFRWKGQVMMPRDELYWIKYVYRSCPMWTVSADVAKIHFAFISSSHEVILWRNYRWVLAYKLVNFRSLKFVASSA